MSSQKQQEISTQPSEVSKVYEGKTIFITGAAGFLGVVLLETLVRCLPGIRRIYILIRPKNGILPEDRKEAIFKKEIFSKIKEKDPDALNKIVVISGDIAHKDLGMNSEVLCKLSQEVSIVFHCAAAISFFKPLSFMMQQNTMGTYNVIEFCRKLKKLDVFVHTSTAFSNSNHREIEEKIYKLPFTAEEAIKVLNKGSEEELISLFSTCKPNFFNFYTFSKCLAELLISERAADLPVCIVRPSVIVCCMKGAVPGYLEQGSAMINLAIGVGKGFIRVTRCDPDKASNYIPADVVVNTHIVAASQHVLESLPTPFIYNCVSSDSDSWTWKQFTSALLEMVVKYPLPNSYQKPNLIICKNTVKYWFVSIFDHYVPAAVIDSLLWLSGHKPRLLKLYRFYDKVLNCTNFFMFNEWSFKIENFQSLGEKMNIKDMDLFSTDLSDFTLKALTECVRKNGYIYREKISNKSNKKQQMPYVQYLVPLIKWSVLGCIASIFYIAVF